MAERINYKELSSLLDEVIKEVELGRIECQKDVPDEVVICDHAVENLGGLLDKISACIFPNHPSHKQGDNSSLRMDIIDKHNPINGFSENYNICGKTHKSDMDMTRQDISFSG